MSHVAGLEQRQDGSLSDARYRNTVGNRPTVKFGEVCVDCLLDTGSHITAVSELFFTKYIQPTGVVYEQGRWFTLSAANGLDIPYKGIAIMDVEVDGQVVKDVGILVTKDNEMTDAVKMGIPGILGTNVLRRLPKFATFFASDDGPSGTVHVAGLDSQLIPANSICKVKLLVSKKLDGKVIVEALPDSIASHPNIAILPTFLDLTVDSATTLVALF